MPSDYYSDSAAPKPMAAPTPSESAPPTDEGRKTTLIPQSLCPGMQAGDTIELKIDRVMDQEYEVSYEKEEGEDAQEEAPMPPSESSQMAPMME